MGRGDKKSKKGKIFKGSYGVVRPKKTNTPVIIIPKKQLQRKKLLQRRKQLQRNKDIIS